MAASTSGALKAHIESLGLGLAGYRDAAPEDAALPYVRISEDIAQTIRQHGDFGAAGAAKACTEEVQLDLFQQRRDPDTGAITESYTIKDALVAGLHGAHLTAAPKHAYGLRVLSATRFPPAPDDDTNVVRHLITVALDRAL